MNPLHTLIMAVIIMVGTLVLVQYISPMCDSPTIQEPFQDSTSVDAPKQPAPNHPTPTQCPPKTTAFTDAEGVIGCCEGDINGTFCHGKVVCSLSTGSKKIPLCIDYLKYNFKRMGAETCPKKMPFYYVENTPNGPVQKCSDSKLKPDLSGPIEPSAKTCFFQDGDEDIKHKNSCIIQKLFEGTLCPAEPCQKKLLQADPKVPIIIQVSFTSPLDKMPHICLEDKSASIYGEFINKPIDPQSPELCSNAKRIYVDGAKVGEA
jgi:hypothetical protein